jgi:hypothetical protein
MTPQYRIDREAKEEEIWAWLTSPFRKLWRIFS